MYVVGYFFLLRLEESLPSRLVFAPEVDEELCCGRLCYGMLWLWYAMLCGLLALLLT